MNAEVTFPEWEKMLFPAVLSETGDSCSQNENSDFEALLFNFFQSNIDIELTYYASVVDFEPPNYYLTIFLPNGDFVEFNEVPRTTLGVREFDKKKFKIYPNPVSDKIYIKNQNSKKISKLKMFSLHGNILVETENNFIDVQLISKGMYLLEIITEDGSKQIEKIIKN